MPHLKRLALSLLIVLVTSLAHADEIDSTLLVGTLLSQHFPDRWKNQSNPGIGIEVDHGRDWKFSVGTYLNSNNRTTDYAVVAWTPLHVSSWDLGVVAGPASGYPSPVIASFMAAYRSGRFGINVLADPPVQGASAVIGLQLTWAMNGY